MTGVHGITNSHDFASSVLSSNMCRIYLCACHLNRTRAVAASVFRKRTNDGNLRLFVCRTILHSVLYTSMISYNITDNTTRYLFVAFQLLNSKLINRSVKIGFPNDSHPHAIRK